MNVLMLTVRADLGGGPEHLFQLLDNRPESAEIWVGCPEDDPYHSRYTELLGADRITTIPHRKFTISALFSLVRLIRHEGIEVVHSHGKGAGLYGRLLALLTKAKAVHTFHGLHVGEYGAAKKAIYLGLEKVLGMWTASAICVSDTEAQAITAAHLIPPAKLRTIVNGVVVPAKANAPVLKKGAPLKILSVSRYDYQKNPDLMLDVAIALKGRREFHMVVLGTGARFDEIRKRVQAEGLGDEVELQGGVPSARPFMAQAHVFLSSSRWEGMPLAVQEAMSEGLCPVVTDVSGNRDLVRDNETGRLYTDASEGAAALAALTDTDVARLSHAARNQIVSAYSVETMTITTFDLLGEVSVQ
ncbi:glycosyltransferase [Tateyamaria sp. Alg231-49]|uniref:glycosyltransferase n=1 Tax=Tateyamaria sp. Alg231-49 TaxID=1922219 RepID=UPI000D55AB1B|nr:glycosyltransferase [Tateyamaria sp. Alg231-49]